MKNLISIAKIMTFMVLAALIFLSCSPEALDEFGTLIINLPGSGSAARATWNTDYTKSQFPYFEEFVNTLSFKIECNAPGISSRDARFGESISIALPVGTWNVTVTARNAANQNVGTSVNSIKIEAGKTNPLNIEIEVETDRFELTDITMKIGSVSYKPTISAASPKKVTLKLVNEISGDTQVEFTGIHTGAVISPAYGTRRLSDFNNGISINAADGSSNHYEFAIEIIDGGEDHAGTSEDPIPLISDVWKNGTITFGGQEVWYSISSSSAAAQRYYVWWDDEASAGNPDNKLDIKVSGFSPNPSTPISNFIDTDYGFSSAQYVDVPAGGIVYIKVMAYYSSSVGNFGITCSTANTRPKINWDSKHPASPINLLTAVASTNDGWVQGNISYAGEVVWYSITNTNTTRYYLWWDDSSNEGNPDNKADIEVIAYRNDDYHPLFDGDSGFYYSQEFDVPANVTVYIKVTGYYTSTTGNYGIACTTVNTRPKINWDSLKPTSPINMVTAATSTTDGWVQGNIGFAGQEVWYTLTNTSATRYYIWWDDVSREGNPANNLDISVYAYQQDDYHPIINGADSGFNSSQSIDVPANGMVYIKVVAYYSSGTGNFGITYSNTNTRPKINWNPPGGVISLTTNGLNTWVSGTISFAGEEIWYSLNNSTASIQRYYIWWDDSSSQGNSAFNTDIKVSAYPNDDYNPIFYEVDSAFNNSQYVDIAASGTVYFQVKPYSSNGTGNFGITYSTTDTRPTS